MKRLICIIISILVIMATVGGIRDNYSVSAYSGDSIPSAEVIDSGTVDEYDSEEITRFCYDGTSVYRIYLKSSIVDKEYYDSYSSTVIINEEDEEYEWNTPINDGIEIGVKSSKYITLDSNDLEEGKWYNVEIIFGENVKITYSINRYNGYADSLTISKSLTVEDEKSKNIDISNINPTKSYPIIKWKSSNTKIAIVDSVGKVTGKNAGKCIISATLSNGNVYNCNITVKNPAPYLKWKSYRIAKGSSFTNKLCYSTGSVKWTTTNKKVATVTSKGKVKAVGFGSCYIKAKSKGKTYKCKVVVFRLTPNYTAYITNYDTRNNRFQVRFKNHGKRKLIVYSKNAKAIDDDYKSYDRNLRLAKGKTYVVIEPGKSKLVNFYVKGSTTWYDEDDFMIRYYIKYHEKKYKARMRSDIEFSDYVKNKKLYYTYWTDVDPYDDLV